MTKIEFKGEGQKDNWPVDQRARLLGEHILPLMEEITDGVFRLDNIVRVKAILEIGCGKGALARIIRENGGRGKIIGVDSYDYVQEGVETSYDNYTQVIVGDIREDETRKRVGKTSYDCILGMQLPTEVRDWIMANKERFTLNKSGMIVLFTERPVNPSSGFQRFQGGQETHSVLIYRK